MKKNLFAIGEGKLKINISGFLSSSCRDGVVGRPIYVLLIPMLLYSWVMCSATAYSDVKTFRCFVQCVSLQYAAKAPASNSPLHCMRKYLPSLRTLSDKQRSWKRDIRQQVVAVV